MRFVLVFCALLATGCPADGPTSLLIDVVVAQGDTAPASLLVSVFDRFGPLAPRDERIKMPPPGKLLIESLPHLAQPIRIALRGGSGAGMRFASVLVDTQPHVQARSAVTLAATVTDTDGDNVADVIDNCPTVANPDQENESGEGSGNACRDATADLTTVAEDLTVIAPDDLAVDPNADMVPPPPDLLPPPDLFGVDAAPADLKPPADLVAPADLKPPVADLKPANPTLCPGTGLLFCESFESGALPAGWDVIQNNATVTVSTTRAYRGTHSMRIQNNTGASTLGRIDHGSILSPTTTTFFARVFLYREPNGIQYPSYFESIAAGGGTGYQAGHSVNQGTLITYSPNTDVTAASMQLGVSRWDCIEWQVSYGTGTTGYQQLWINDSAAVDMSGIAIGQLDQFFMGYGSSWENKASVVYFDELILDDQRIGCAK